MKSIDVAGCHIEVAEDVAALRPDFAAYVIVARNLRLSADAPRRAAEILAEAVTTARAAGATADPAEHPHVVAWRNAYRAFGAKPSRTRCSVEALLRRMFRGELPTVSPLVDVYNAVSICQVLPVGGEDLDRYQGFPRLVRAVGNEVFETSADGEAVLEKPEAGEVIWVDDAGVTCRRWNWRQSTRTALSDTTRNAFFLLERLTPYPLETLDQAAAQLTAHLKAIAPEAALADARLGPWG